MTEQNKDQIKEKVLDCDVDQLGELLDGESENLPKIEIPFEFYDDKQFMKGIEETSHLSGRITAMLNTGLSSELVMDFLLTEMTINHNLQVAEINRDIAKNQKATQDKFEL